MYGFYRHTTARWYIKIIALLSKAVRLLYFHSFSSHNKTGDIMKNKMSFIFGLLCGFLNGLFGSGGGTVAVPCLEKSGLEVKKAHASSVLLIFVLSIFTAIIYFLNGNLDLGLAMDYIPYGIVGAVIGSLTLKKISSDILKKIFAIIIIISGVRILL